MKKTILLSTVLLSIPLFLIAQEDVDVPANQLFTEDVFIQGSLMVGIDSENNANFGFDTVILRENNLRMLFDDTSTTGSFANND